MFDSIKPAKDDQGDGFTQHNLIQITTSKLLGIASSFTLIIAEEAEVATANTDDLDEFPQQVPLPTLVSHIA